MKLKVIKYVKGEGWYVEIDGYHLTGKTIEELIQSIVDYAIMKAAMAKEE